MSLQKFVLSEQTASTPVGPLLEQAASGGVEIRNADGEVLAYLLSPHDQEAWAYAEASMDILHHREEILAAAKRPAGVSTKELLANAERAGKMHDLNNALAVIGDLVHETIEQLKSPAARNASGEKAAAPKSKAG